MNEAVRGAISEQSGAELAEYDVRNCHPYLLHKFCNAQEAPKYEGFLAGDVYNQILAQLPQSKRNRVTRDACKKRFMRFLNGGRGYYVTEFYQKHFPALAEFVLKTGKGMASVLQQLESQVAVWEMGAFCKENNLFYLPMHDGFICRKQEEARLCSKIAESFHKLIGIYPIITGKSLGEEDE